MKIECKRYSFELPDSWAKLAEGRESRNRVAILLPEDDRTHSGLLVTLKTLRRRDPAADERLGRLTAASGEAWELLAFYGTEGACSEENEDLYWRARDQLWMVYRSIRPAVGFRWEASELIV